MASKPNGSDDKDKYQGRITRSKSKEKKATGNTDSDIRDEDSTISHEANSSSQDTAPQSGDSQNEPPRTRPVRKVSSSIPPEVKVEDCSGEASTSFSGTISPNTGAIQKRKTLHEKKPKKGKSKSKSKRDSLEVPGEEEEDLVLPGRERSRETERSSPSLFKQAVRKLSPKKSREKRDDSEEKCFAAKECIEDDEGDNTESDSKPKKRKSKTTIMKEKLSNLVKKSTGSKKGSCQSSRSQSPFMIGLIGNCDLDMVKDSSTDTGTDATQLSEEMELSIGDGAITPLERLTTNSETDEGSRSPEKKSAKEKEENNEGKDP